ncbi:hypothetical protein BHM03_00051061, partial [Ensete ventricosum]
IPQEKKKKKPAPKFKRILLREEPRHPVIHPICPSIGKDPQRCCFHRKRNPNTKERQPPQKPNLSPRETTWGRGREGGRKMRSPWLHRTGANQGRRWFSTTSAYVSGGPSAAGVSGGGRRKVEVCFITSIRPLTCAAGTKEEDEPPFCNDEDLSPMTQALYIDGGWPRRCGRSSGRAAESPRRSTRWKSYRLPHVAT